MQIIEPLFYTILTTVTCDDACTSDKLAGLHSEEVEEMCKKLFPDGPDYALIAVDTHGSKEVYYSTNPLLGLDQFAIKEGVDVVMFNGNRPGFICYYNNWITYVEVMRLDNTVMGKGKFCECALSKEARSVREFMRHVQDARDKADDDESIDNFYATSFKLSYEGKEITLDMGAPIYEAVLDACNTYLTECTANGLVDEKIKDYLKTVQS